MKVDEAGIKKQLGQSVREHRLKAGISQEKLAELTGLHRTYISDIECGTRNVAIINIVRIAEALSSHPSVLLEGIAG